MTLRLSFYSLLFCFMGVSLLEAQESRQLGVMQFSVLEQEGGIPTGWVERGLGISDRPTVYRVVNDDDTQVVEALSDNSASALTFPLRVQASPGTTLRWRWKVANTLEQGNALEKSGDDYAARIYVLFDVKVDELPFFEQLVVEAYHLLHGDYPPLGALNYLWANKHPIGSLLPNIYSEQVQMYIVNSGNDKLGQWVEHQRDIYADYVRAFGREPPAITGIAIMSDTDNTGERARAWFGDIFLDIKP